MVSLEQKNALVVGLGLSGIAASRLLRRKGAVVLAIDTAETENLKKEAEKLRLEGIAVSLGVKNLPQGSFDLAVVSPGVPPSNPVVMALVQSKVPIIGEFELGYQSSLCLNIAITGTNGKTTTTEMVERLLSQNQIKTLAGGNIGKPVCDLVEETRNLDFLTLEVSSFQLERIEYFRPAIGVLMNITPDHLDRYEGMADYAMAKAQLFKNQQPFDWAIVQQEALDYLHKLKIEIPSKVITFSATARNADLFLERGLIISRMSEWAGPLLNMEDCKVFGPHNAENLMAALAVGKILRIPLESMLESLKTYAPAPHRCEIVAEINGVKYINDSKATNVDALQKALLSVPASQVSEPNVWLIAGGKDKGFHYHDAGPLLAQKVKGAFLIGETREKIHAAWGLFTPCTPMDSLLEAVSEAARNAVAGDVVLLSPACSSFDQFQNYQHRGDVFKQAVMNLKGAGTGRSRDAEEMDCLKATTKSM